MMNSKVYATILLCFTTLLLFADQNLTAPNLSAIAKDFGFDDLEKDEKLGGEIALGFFITGGFASVLVGVLADNFNRSALFCAIVIIGELGCIAIYFVTTYSQFYYCRILTGISIGGAAPIVYSLLADYHPSSMRIYISTLVGISMGLGVSCGQLLSGLLSGIASWRVPFVLIAGPAICSALLIFMTVKEPVRGIQDVESAVKSFHLVDETRYAEKFEFSKILKLIRSPTILLCLLQGLPGCIPWGVIGTYLNDYLSSDCGYSVRQATTVLTVFGVGALVGQIFGGWLGQRLYNYDTRFQCVLMGASTALGTLPMLFVINAQQIYLSIAHANDGINTIDNLTIFETKRLFMLVLLASFCAGCVAAITGPNIRSVLQNVSPPELRGTAFSIFNLTDDLGKGGGPALIARLTVVLRSRRLSFTVGVCAWVVCGLLLALIGLTVKADEDAIVMHIRGSIKRHGSNDENDMNEEGFPLLPQLSS